MNLRNIKRFPFYIIALVAMGAWAFSSFSTEISLIASVVVALIGAYALSMLNNLETNEIKKILKERQDYKLRFDELNNKLTRKIQEHHVDNMTKSEMLKELVQLYEVAEHSPEGIIITDNNGQIKYVNESTTKITGYNAKEIEGSNISIVEPNKDSSENKQKWSSLKSGEVYKGNITMVHKYGELFKSEQYAFQILENGEVTGYAITFRNVDKNDEIEKQLIKLSNVFTSAKSAIMITETDGTIIDVNDAFTEITGYSSAEVVGKKPNVLKSGRHTENFYQTMWVDIIEKGYWIGTMWDRKKSGELYRKHTSISTAKDSAGNPLYYIAVFSVLKENEAKDISKNVLTNLPNYNSFYHRLSYSIEQIKRSVTKVPTVVMIDISGTQRINEAFGYDVGDSVISQLAKRLSDQTRDSDTLAHLSDDNFAIIAMEENPLFIAKLVERTLKIFKEPFLIKDHKINISCNIGISIYGNESVNTSLMIKHAQMALNRSKLDPDKVWSFYSKTIDNETKELIDYHKNLESAVNNNEIIIKFMPKKNTHTGKISVFEVLTRWRNNESMLESPEKFLNIAEETETIYLITNSIMKQSFNQIDEWTKQGDQYSLSINISTKQFYEKNFVSNIKDLVTSMKTKTQFLIFEITENTLLKDTEKSSIITKELSKLGIKISVDDFGTGYSSISLFKSYPIYEIKLSRSMVESLNKTEFDNSMVKSIIDLAHNFNVKVCAKGVEDAQQEETLSQYGCDYIQGSHISMAIHENEIKEFLS